jgi:DNA-binding YbaB/EbfC family protein
VTGQMDPADAGGLDLGALLGAAGQMMQAQQAAAQAEVVGTAGGGLVEVRVTGGGEFVGVRLDPSVLDPSDPALVEDLVLAALRDAMAGVQQLQASAMGGLDLGALGGLLGGAGPTS